MTDPLPPIYTRTGDDGQTSLYDGTRASKCHPRIEALGAMDELTSYLAVCRHHVEADSARRLSDIQQAIYALNAIIATPGAARPMAVPPVEALEAAIDGLKADDLAPRFLQVGSTEAAAHLHFARTLCRRAERHLWRLAETEPCDDDVLRYVNRLSDLLYMLAVHHEGDRAYLSRE